MNFAPHKKITKFRTCCDDCLPSKHLQLRQFCVIFSLILIICFEGTKSCDFCIFRGEIHNVCKFRDKIYEKISGKKL